MARSRKVDFNLLIALRALLEERNVSRASQTVNMSQSAVSVALSRLREHYEDELLVRHGRGYELTPLAEELLPEVRAALESVAVAFHPWAAFDPATSSREFSISASDYTLSMLARPLFAAVGRQAPGVTIRFDPFPAEGSDLTAHLLRCDLLFGALGFGIPGRRQVVFNDRFVCIVSAGHPRLHDGAMSLADLAELPHARAGFGARGMTLLDEVLVEAGLRPRVRVTVPGLLELPFAVSGTELWTFVPERLLASCPASLNLVPVAVPFETAETVEAAHWHPTRHADPGLRWLRSLLQQEARGLVVPRLP